LHWKAYEKSVSSLRMNRLRDLSLRVQLYQRHSVISAMTPVRTENSDSDVVVMQSTEERM